uniref:Uncharacterized protein n=1 Tax=Zooxanthella nutricula TaxID=1333877 RepID=A0A7S2VLB7_9DINO
MKWLEDLPEETKKDIEAMIKFHQKYGPHDDPHKMVDTAIDKYKEQADTAYECRGFTDGVRYKCCARGEERACVAKNAGIKTWLGNYACRKFNPNGPPLILGKWEKAVPCAEGTPRWQYDKEEKLFMPVEEPVEEPVEDADPLEEADP